MNLPIHLFNIQLLAAADMSADATSASLDVKEAVTVAIQAVWTGATPIGTLHIQASCDGTNFTDVSGGSQAVTGNTGTLLFNLPNIGYSQLRAFYDNTSGTGNITVTANGKRS